MRRLLTWPLLHFSLAALVCLAIPGASWLDGSGSLAWTMYSSSASYRLRIAGFDAKDELHWISTLRDRRALTQDLKVVLSGAEGFRHGPHGVTLRDRLPLIASFTCELARARRVELTLEERRNLDAPVRATRFTKECQATHPP